MIQIKNLSLIRTTRDYQSTTVRDLMVQALQSPVTYFTGRKITEFFLKDICLLINPGEKVALIGRNGSGKSTLCRLIAQQLYASQGMLKTEGKVSLFSEFESCFFEDLTGRENLEFFVKFIYSQKTSIEQNALVEECVFFSGLEKKINRPLSNYSLGMISRLALSLMTVHPHEILILDEVHSHADENFRIKASLRMKEIVDQTKTLILVSHYEQDLISTCQRGIVLDQGKILFDGAIQKALACYKLLPKADHV